MKIDESEFHTVYERMVNGNDVIYSFNTETLTAVIMLCERYARNEAFRSEHVSSELCDFFINSAYFRLMCGTTQPIDIANTVSCLYKVLYGRRPRYFCGFISKNGGMTRARINFCQRVVDRFEAK